MEGAYSGTLGGYAITGLIGQGGMGTVYRARHPRLPLVVALKVLNRDASADPELRARFEREAAVVAHLDHPGIVSILDCGLENEQLWLAMQYIEGTDASRLDPRAVTTERAVRIIGEVANALDYAHGRGVLHRDGKPANILLASEQAGRAERAVLTDFGISRLLSANTQLTSTGTFTGTLAFASPEHLSGLEIDHRSDQYSLACTLFALLEGRTPFTASDPGQVVAGHLAKPVPPLVRPDAPPQLDAVIARAMAKNPAARFTSAREFAAAAYQAISGSAVRQTTQHRARPADRHHAPTDADSAPLESAAEGGSSQPNASPTPRTPTRSDPPPSPRWARLGGIALIATVVLAAAAGLVYFTGSSHSPPSPHPTTTTPTVTTIAPTTTPPVGNTGDVRFDKLLGAHPMFLAAGVSPAQVDCQLPAWSTAENAKHAYYQAELNCLDSAWQTVLTRFGYTGHPVTLYTGNSSDYHGACTAYYAHQTFYCPTDDSVIMPIDQTTGYDQGSDTQVLALLYGYHLQSILGILSEVTIRVSQVGDGSEAGLRIDRQYSLQARCLAGMFFGVNVGHRSITSSLFDAVVAGTGGDTPGQPRILGSNENAVRWLRWGYSPSADITIKAQPSTFECNPWNPHDPAWIE
ncbi:protein kinase [Nocardia sp. ET3-3]|uniref:non-specific serine/threonine protein kinase n=2 Tax=Nocardia terrae TaxID=2675851 RepID=A0A7K1US95_9NOCA|nr:protein kinase [Nocardia terrae]